MYQPIKWYMWPMACFTNPSFSDQRIELTKPISLVYVIDDVFDVYGTLDQLTLFTYAVNRFPLSFLVHVLEVNKPKIYMYTSTTTKYKIDLT